MASSSVEWRGNSPSPTGLSPLINVAGLELQQRHNTIQEDGNDGVVLTWKDVWVRAPNASQAILQGLTGFAEPGKVLAIMGPSGSGKSTLLDTLAGRLDIKTRYTGEILINGRRETLAFGTSAYVTQEDNLLTTLTTRETLYYSAKLQLPDSMTTAEKKERAEIVMKQMGLHRLANTRVGGGSGSKGLSGGEKRRLSICVEILPQPKLLFLDEPTSGLDSAASYHVIKSIIELACQGGRTILLSIHQPSSEVFELFHSLYLLSAGKTIYFGPISMAEQFFTASGFPCPSFRNPSDHYLRIINKDFDNEDIEHGQGNMRTEDVLNILVNSYKSSIMYQEVEYYVSNKENGGNSMKKGSNASFITQSIVLTRRSCLNMYRDLGYYWIRLVIYIGLGICLGTIFFHIGLTFGSIQARGSMLMFVATFLTFMAIGGFPSFVEDVKVFKRERLNGHYGVGAFVIANTLSSIPYLFINSLIPGAIVYFLVGLHKGFEQFSYFILLLFVSTMLVESLMMIVASLVPTFLIGIIVGSGLQGLMILAGGFFRLPNDLPKPFWKYPMYYISTHKYTFQGFYKNEYQGLSFPSNQLGGSATISGEEVLKIYWQVQISYSKWIDLLILVGMMVFYRFMFWVIVKVVEKFKPVMKGSCYSHPDILPNMS